MSLTRPLDRRTFLRASGVALALPLLESMTPALARVSVTAPRRMLNICNTLGLYSSSWFPTTAGAGYETTEYLSLIDQHREHYTLFTGYSHEEQSGRQPHNSEITWLTSARRPGLDRFRNSISIDQVAANHLGYVTRFPSVVLGTARPQSQSYTSSGAMVPAESSPANLFKQLFLQGTPEEVERAMRSLSAGASILDRLKSQTTALRGRVSSADHRTLDAYFDAVRTAEHELGEVQAWQQRAKPVVALELPEDLPNPADLVGRVKLMFRLIPLILETDSSRVISLMLHDHGVVLNVPGVTIDQHGLSHHGQDESKIAQLKRIETELVTAFGELLTDLRGRADADGGSLLDSTMVLFGSNLGNANAHAASDLPILLAGGGFHHGEHIVHEGEENAPLSNLFVTMLQNMGVETDAFGQSSSALVVTWGAPDLGGVWDFRTITPLERPEALGDQEFLSEEEVAAREQAAAERDRTMNEKPAERTEAGGEIGAYNWFWLDFGTQVVESGRTSLIVDPPNGRHPPMTPEALEAARNAPVWGQEPPPDTYLDRNDFDRCIGTMALPIYPTAYNNNVQIFQTPDHVAMYVEMMGSIRIIPLDDRPATSVRQALGDSRGRWEGDTLVVETTNFSRRLTLIGASPNARSLVERFRPVSPGILEYTFTIDDPTVWTALWTAVQTLRTLDGQVFEYACHEGNYAMPNILGGARKAEAEAAAGGAGR